jgi:cytochrome c556
MCKGCIIKLKELLMYREQVKEHEENYFSGIRKAKEQIDANQIEIEINEAGSISISTENSSTTCSVCNKKFRYKCELRRHIEAVHEKKTNFECDLCQKKCYSKSAIKEHIQRHIKRLNPSFPLPFECSICQKSFITSFELHRHKLTHSSSSVATPLETLSATCSTCYKKFRCKTELRKHIEAVHEKKTNFECNYCQKKFYYKQQIKTHPAS